MVARSSSSSAWINVAVIGPHQHGKSTLAGFLLYALHQLPTKFMNEADRAANKRKDPTRKFAFLLDRKAHERKMGLAVHCAAGLGRTGVVLACYFIDKGLTAANAIARVRRLRPGSIETEEQEKAIEEFHWKRQHKD